MRIREEYWNTIKNEKSTRFNDFEWESNDAIIYMFHDGNYCCDCNRSLFMYNWDMDKLLECSETPIIKVNIYNQETNEIIYKEY